MLSFPSTLNTGGNNINLPTLPKRSAADILKNIGQSFVNSLSNTLTGGLFAFVNGASASGGKPDMSRLPYDYALPFDIDRRNIFSDAQVGIHPSGQGRPQFNAAAAKNLWYSNPVVFSPEIYSLMNTYRYVYSAGVLVPSDGRKYDGQGNEIEWMYGEFDGGDLSPSLFNPYYGIQRIGATKNTPLTDDSPAINAGNFSKDFTDCSIATLCKMSAKTSSELGQARYKYSDFMYCKDLGLPNNRMITLRKFSTPVGDNIMGESATSQSGTYSVPSDIGRLVTYFDTDDNKLEDILNYSFAASWVEKTAEIQQLASKEDDRESALGMLLNTMSSQYRDSFTNSITGGNNLFDYFLGKTNFGSNSWYQNNETLYNYDKNKVYDPIDTVRSMHLYEGKLQFNHEFTLTFNYTLRSYDNINPKSAMLDLLANITAVTYKRGHFWGGRQEIIGAQPNMAGWQKANAIIDKQWDRLGGIFQSMVDGGFNLSGMLGNFANYFQNIGDTFKSMTSNMEGTIKEAASQATSDQAKKRINQVAGALGAMAKAKLKDTLGRPQMYAFNSILTGDNTGLWHVTIGNPRNPIAVMGNMILTDAKVTQYGPLGMDDFPTGLKVTVTLKHARPRDMVDIQKMYTRGIAAIYTPMENPQGMTGDLVHYNNSPSGVMYAGDFSPERIRRNAYEIK